MYIIRDKEEQLSGFLNLIDHATDVKTAINWVSILKRLTNFVKLIKNDHIQ